METVALAVHAMATRFELVLHGEDAARLRAAGEEALREIERLERELSLFRPESEISALNSKAAREPVQVSAELFGLLEHAKRLHAETGGAFDITIAPLVRCWGFMGGGGRVPSAKEVEEARQRVGMNLVELNAEGRTVRFEREGVMLDLGAIGKGYAVERAVEVLREAGVTSGLVHGGTSTVYGIGTPPNSDGWRLDIEKPGRGTSAGLQVFIDTQESKPKAFARGEGDYRLAIVSLRDEALSVSAVWGRSFRENGEEFGHVLDPQTGKPVAQALMAVVALPSATETDAFSTALLISGREGLEAISGLRPGMRTLLVSRGAGQWKAEAKGISLGR
jgi:thiamine biosynthesis lipoprotein